MVNAIHSSGIGSFAPKSLANGGEAAGFIIRLENGYTIYHAGDTSIFGDMKLYSTLYRPDLALLPIGGRFTMGPEDAALATVLLSPRVVIPMHFGGTFQLPGDPNRFRDSVFKRLQKKVKVIIPTPGKVIE
jgi:L-ascorbate metabolism protein UlaG (beta-lactamase superfamily)